MTSLKMNTQTGQVYIDNKLLCKDEKGYHTISSEKCGSKKIKFKVYINDTTIINQIEKFLKN